MADLRPAIIPGALTLAVGSTQVGTYSAFVGLHPAVSSSNCPRAPPLISIDTFSNKSNKWDAEVSKAKKFFGRQLG